MRAEIFISLGCWMCFYDCESFSLCFCPRFANRQPRQHCKFTYNNAHTLIQPLNSSQLFAYLISHLLFSVFYFYSHFMHEIRLVFLFAQ